MKEIVEITSVNNEIVKNVAKLQQKKYRKTSKLIVLEGEKSVQGALLEGQEITSIFVLDEVQNKDIIQKTDTKIYKVNQKVMEKISSTASNPSILALVKEPVYKFDDFLNFEKIALIDGIKDAGNLGTIIRSAIAFNIEGIILFGECVDEFSSKVIRSSAGNIFKVPIIRAGYDIEAIKKFEKTHKIYLTVVDPNAKAVNEVDFKGKCLLCLGSEASGLGEKILNIKGEKITLPMKKNVESLNLAVFAGIMFYIINS